MHIHRIEDERGDLIDIVPFCSDYCHRDWCRRSGVEYRGWDGAHEASPDYPVSCVECELPLNDPNTGEE